MVRVCAMTAAAVTVCGIATYADESLHVVEDGKSSYVVAVPDGEEEAAKVAEAADALQVYIERSTGVRLRIVPERETCGAPAFYLGRTKRGAAAGVPYGGLVDYVTFRKAFGRDIVLAGNDESAGVNGPLQYHDREYLCHKFGLNLDVSDMSYRRWHGTLRAVLDFLDAVHAVEILMPGENGLNVIRQKSLLADGRALPGLDSWAFQYSNGRCYGNIVASTALGHTQIPHYKTWGGHTMPVAVPRSKYEKTHPEYFIMKDGRRRPDYGPAHGGHHCVSNPDVLDLVVAEMKRQYSLGYRWIQFGPTDGQVPCECGECARMHPDPTERQWIFSRRVAERARAEMPGAKVVILAYVFTRWPPKSFDTFPDNVIVEMTLYRQGEELLAAWRDRFPDVPKLAYTYFFGDYHSWASAPTCSPKYLEKHMRLMKESNVQGIFKCGMIQDPGLEAPIAWVFSQLLKDPYRDADALADEFCEKAYGRGAEPMKRFLKLMYADLMTPMGHSVIDEMRKTPHAPAQMFNYAFRPVMLKSMGRHLAQAEVAAKFDPKASARLALVRRSYDFLLLRAKCYNVQASWELFGSPDVLTLADRIYDEREKMLDGWYGPDGRMKPLEGFDWPYLCNREREVVVRGGGQIVPSFPELFRYGRGSVKERLGKGKFSLLESEYWEGYRECGRRMLLGDGLEELKSAAEARKGANFDMKGVLSSILSFREKHRDFLVDGTLIGEFTPLDPVDNVFGVFRKNVRGETALFVCATSETKQVVRFRFPGSDKIETRALGLCTLHVFKENA